MRRMSPQEKKRLSYRRDRRNVYGENDKSSRKSIRRNKRATKSANRRLERLALAQGACLRGIADADAGADVIERGLARRWPKSWKKFPDAPLGEVVANALERRARTERQAVTRAPLS
ncbi:hypothetical protein [Streptomyces sp. NPDC046925]|uniref:hypothetical protein n=1 Tax=Streptomyces sp. NPDC046925 TaxID=3155375 RepID=UPI003410B1FC